MGQLSKPEPSVLEAVEPRGKRDDPTLEEHVLENKQEAAKLACPWDLANDMTTLKLYTNSWLAPK